MLLVHKERPLREDGGSTPSKTEQKQFIDRHSFWKLNGSLPWYAHKRRAEDRSHKDTDFPRDGEEIWKAWRVSGKEKKKPLIFIAWLWPSGAGKRSKWDINWGNQSLVVGPAGPKTAKCSVPTSVHRTHFITFCSWVWGERLQTGFLAKSGQWESCTFEVAISVFLSWFL